MLTGRRFAEQIRADGIEFLPWPADADYDETRLNDCFPGRAKLSGPRAVIFDIRNMFAGPLPAQAQAIASAIDREPVDAIVTEFSMAGVAPMLIVKRPRPPVHVLGCTPLLVRSRNVFPYGLGLVPPSTRAGRIACRMVTRLVTDVALRRLSSFADQQLARAGAGPAPVFFLEWFTLADAFWQLTVPDFEYPRERLPANLRFVGPLLVHSDFPLPEWWPDLEDGKPIIHVTQGTLDNEDTTMLLQPTIEALAELDIHVVVVTGGRGALQFDGPRPNNLRVASMLPYDILLPRLAAMVTNGGFGGVQHALSAGVPLVVAGENQDKPEVAARVAWAGVGINLRTGHPSPEKIRAAVHEVLNEPRYRQQANDIAQRIESTDALSSIVAALERGTGPSRDLS